VLYYLVGIDLTVVDGLDEITALTLIGELGTDFTKWPTVKHFTSWLGLCPNFKKTGGRVKSSQTRKGKNPAARALRMAASPLQGWPVAKVLQRAGEGGEADSSEAPSVLKRQHVAILFKSLIDVGSGRAFESVETEVFHG
jgi:hypothetical protein